MSVALNDRQDWKNGEAQRAEHDERFHYDLDFLDFWNKI
jgi:hypothetical protein